MGQSVVGELCVERRGAETRAVFKLTDLLDGSLK
jgi:hypothetical protein